ncbi:hypothetical protein [Hymenobacter sp. PAMC 26628]|uniref:hypothetical protein n=1 Tax=Hymenobacter sp. PAMC 26628 TaxID=1484118 RepID=UPI0007706276|nr:hypothetical protein [Hymenobacter sp. PAMC 26628]AMJ65022.1 hypothetical protein AXW84_05975 [Hymenobacter sp. PAMC 26628]
MIITVESTSKTVELNGVPARIWEGKTDSGIVVHCFITRVAIDQNETRIDEFERELRAQRTPSAALEVYPLRLIL